MHKNYKEYCYQLYSRKSRFLTKLGVYQAFSKLGMSAKEYGKYESQFFQWYAKKVTADIVKDVFNAQIR